MNKAKRIEKSGFTAMECVIQVLTDSSLDEMRQLSEIKRIAYNWSILLKEIVNEIP